MKNKKKLVILFSAFIILMGGAYALYGKLGQNVKPDQMAVQDSQVTEQAKENEQDAVPENDVSEKTPATDFTVYDMEGNEVHLSDYIGKPVVLNFWASWCGPCKMELPDFEKKYQEMGEDIQFLMVNMTDGTRETKEIAYEYISSEKYTLPVFYDTESIAANTYQVYSIPTTYFIDAEGYLIAQATGAIDGETLQQGIDMIMP